MSELGILRWSRFVGRNIFEEVKAIIESQLQAEFLRGEGAGRKSGAKLIEQMGQQKGQWLEQDQRMIQFCSLFKDQRRFNGN